MKKLFIGAALITCSLIGYTQGEVSPSFRNYLNNKKSFPLPRVLNAPVKSDIPIDALANGNKLKIEELKKYLDREKERSTPFSGTRAGSLPNGNELFVLPQDNMLCVVPDQSPFNMPVAKGNNQLDKRINVSDP